MVVLLTRHLKSTGGDQRRIKGVWISLLFPLFSADTPDVKRFAQVFLYQCSYGRASANIGGQNLLTSDVIYQLRHQQTSLYGSMVYYDITLRAG
jgi:hypothetical protein